MSQLYLFNKKNNFWILKYINEEWIINPKMLKSVYAF